MNEKLFDELLQQAFAGGDGLVKFAELIVRECAQVDSEANNPDHIDGENYNQTILEHFGVEE